MVGGPIRLYMELAKKGRLRVDQHQLNTMNLLQNLHQSLIDYTPLTKSRNNTSTSSSISSPSSGSVWQQANPIESSINAFKLSSCYSKWSRYLGASLKTSSNAKADSSRTPKGLYLWGDVGTVNFFYIGFALVNRHLHRNGQNNGDG